MAGSASASEMGQEGGSEASAEAASLLARWGGNDPLTLPESLALSHRLSLSKASAPADIPENNTAEAEAPTSTDPTQDAGPSRRRASNASAHTLRPSEPSCKERRVSLSASDAQGPAGTSPSHARSRSGSGALAPGSPPGPSVSSGVVRRTRPRAPTLAGEAMEHAQTLAQAHIEAPQRGAEEGATAHGELGASGPGDAEPRRRVLGRCFITMHLVSRVAASPRANGSKGYALAEIADEDPAAAGSTPRGTDPSVPFPRPRRQFSAEGQGQKGPNVLIARSASAVSVNRVNHAQSGASASANGNAESHPRPLISGSNSTRSLRDRGAPTASTSRQRTSSLNSTASLPSPSANTSSPQLSASTPTLNGAGGVPTSASAGPTDGNANAAPKFGSRPPRLVRAPSDTGRARRPTLSRPSSMMVKRPSSSHAGQQQQQSPVNEKSSMGPPALPLATATATATATASRRVPTETALPFFISPIHRPSSYPRFAHLCPESDYATWLSPAQAAQSTLRVEVWYEDQHGDWALLPGVGGEVDLTRLRRVEGDGVGGLGENAVIFSLEGDGRGLYVLQEDERGVDEGHLEGNGRGEVSGQTQAYDHGVVERSLRETRMKRGAGVGALHQLVNTQAVLLDTQRGIGQVVAKIDALLKEDADQRAAHRELSQRQAKVTWLRQSIEQVERDIATTEERILRRRAELASRRSNLDGAEEYNAQRAGVAIGVYKQINSTRAETSALQPRLDELRARHVQVLDALVPISPILPSALLYGILHVPLPIPTAPQDLAPPLTFTPPPGLERDHIQTRNQGTAGTLVVDEKTTAAALGYVALVLQVLVGLGGAAGRGLGYPVTYAGGRSVVKDVTSVMSGPRSFPLYTKGVERYRFEYAVFLLNKNIEMLMQEANLRLVDARHTLPNLKALLLTLSSPTLPPPLPVPASSAARTLSAPGTGTSTYVNSRAASRQTSHTFAMSPAQAQWRASLGGAVVGSPALPRGMGSGGYGTPAHLGHGMPVPLPLSFSRAGSVVDTMSAQSFSPERERERVKRGLKGGLGLGMGGGLGLDGEKDGREGGSVDETMTASSVLGDEGEGYRL